jgi:glycosyltransferase involved in cell wall biosynthesis
MIQNLKKPLVSVVINCYNGAEYLRQAVDSVISQTFTNWELIFWDNQSTDGSAEIIQAYHDTRIKYFLSKSHTNLGEARKNAVDQCVGEFISFLDCDDYWMNDKLEIQYNALRESKALLCYGGVRILDSNEKFVTNILPKHNSGYIFNDLLRDFDINMTTPMIRKRSLITHELNFDTNIFASEEVNLFLKLAFYGEIICLHEVLATARLTGNSLTNNSIGFWHRDLEYTIDQLLDICPNLKFQFPEGYRKILARFYYYKSRYYLSRKQRLNSIYLGIRCTLLERRYLKYLFLLLLPFSRKVLFFYENKSYRYKAKKLLDRIKL